MYLLKYLAHCGLCSRRKAVELIKSGRIAINGCVVTMPFSLVSEGDVVTYSGKVVTPEAYVYLMLNKPKGYLTTCSDEVGRKTVMELIAGVTDKRIYPVGRLDRMSTGILLFTNDGALAQKLSHPSGNVPKVYRVLLNRPLVQKNFDKLLEGFELGASRGSRPGFIKADSCVYSNPIDKCDVIIEIHSGMNRVVRRMFEHIGYVVEKLDRIGYSGLTKGSLARGEWRFLNKKEIKKLKVLR